MRESQDRKDCLLNDEKYFPTLWISPLYITSLIVVGLYIFTNPSITFFLLSSFTVN